jgi:hypothetical protein
LALKKGATKQAFIALIADKAANSISLSDCCSGSIKLHGWNMFTFIFIIIVVVTGLYSQICDDSAAFIASRIVKARCNNTIHFSVVYFHGL